MKKQLLISIILFSIMLIAGCSSTQTTSVAEKVPDWYLNPVADANYLSAPVTAQSKDMQMAIDKAVIDGRAEIGRQIELRLTGLQKKFDEEVGVNTNATLLQMYTQASKTVVSSTLVGSKVAKREVLKNGDIYQAFVLVQYPVGATAEALAQQIKNKEELYTRYRASQALKDLDDEAKKYEDWKQKTMVQ